MPFTRAQAGRLLDRSGFALFEDSRANVLRTLRASVLQTRIARTRAAIVKVRGAKRGGRDADGARRIELLRDILARFEDAAPAARKREGATARAPAARTPANKAASRKSAAKKSSEVTKHAGAARPAATTKAASKKAAAAAKNVATGKAGVARKTPAPAKKRAAAQKARVAAAAITPRRALANTRRLLERKQADQRGSQPWQSLDPAPGHQPAPGFQSPSAASRANDLHAGESRMASIHGSMSTRDRRNQGRRDRRSDSND